MSAPWQVSVEREGRRIRAHAGRAIVQLLFTRPNGLSVERIRQLLREGFVGCTDPLERAVASLGTDELISAVVETDRPLSAMGLHLEVVNGIARLVTLPVRPAAFAIILGDDPECFAENISRAALEILAAIALRQPVSTADLALWFEADKRAHLDRLLQLGLIEKIKHDGGRVHFATTGEFLRRFRLRDHQQLLSEFAQRAEFPPAPIPE